MLGPSRQSLAEVRQRLLARTGDAAFAGLSDELLAVSGVLGTNRTLRRTLSDGGLAAERKQGIVRRLFEGKVSPLALDLLTEVVSRHWSTPADMTDAVEQLGAEAAFVVAERDGTLDTVEDELFRFGRIASGQHELLTTLDDLSISADGRVALIGDLLRGRADPTTVKLLEHVTRNPRGRRFEAALRDLLTLAAARRDQLVADVRSATALTAQQEERLAAALARVYGRDVHLQVSVEPDLLGGVVVQVGDEIIDGSIASRLEQARRQVAS